MNIPITIPSSDTSLVKFRNPETQTQIEGELNDTKNEIATLSAAAEAETIFLDNLVRLHRKGRQICQHLDIIRLPECDSSLAIFGTALEKTKQAIPLQRKAEQEVRNLLIMCNIPHDESRTELQSLQAFVKEPKLGIEILKNGLYTQELATDLADYLLRIPCICSDESKKSLESIRGKNSKNPLEKDISFLIGKLEFILNKIYAIEADFQVNMTTYKNMAAAAKNAYDTLEGQFKQVKATVPKTEQAEVPPLEFNSFTINIKKIKGNLEDANTAIDALFVASEASEVLSLESLVWIHQQAFRIYGQLAKVDLPGSRPSLDLFKTALEKTKQTIQEQKEVEADALGLTTDYNMRHENQPVTQSVLEFAECLRDSVKRLLEKGTSTQALVKNITKDLLLQVPSIVEVCKPELEGVLARNQENPTTPEDRSFLIEILNLILSEVEPLEARFQMNTTTCKNMVIAADHAYEALYGQFWRAKRIVAEMEAGS